MQFNIDLSKVEPHFVNNSITTPLESFVVYVEAVRRLLFEVLLNSQYASSKKKVGTRLIGQLMAPDVEKNTESPLLIACHYCTRVNAFKDIFVSSQGLVYCNSTCHLINRRDV